MGCDNIPHIIIIYVYFKTTSSRVSLEGLAPQDIPPSDEVGKMGVLQYIFIFFKSRQNRACYTVFWNPECFKIFYILFLINWMFSFSRQMAAAPSSTASNRCTIYRSESASSQCSQKFTREWTTCHPSTIRNDMKITESSIHIMGK